MKLLLRKIRVALTPRSWLLKTRLSNGALVRGSNRPGHGGRGVYVFRDSLEPELEQLERLLVPGGVFVDVGGNTGIFTVKAAQFFRANGGGTVVAYEPLPEMLGELNSNVHLNGFDNVRLRSFCLGSQPGTTDFWINFNRLASSGLVHRDPQAVRRSVLVLRFDDVFPLEALNRLDYVKIDVEGAEDQVLAGARATLKKFRPIVQFEIGVHDVRLELENYTAYQCPGGPNKICLPNESPKISVVEELHWQKLA
jgi:FkbM family methyltransferase